MVEAVYVGGIGSSNTELSRFILDDTDSLILIKKLMEGCELIIDDEGRRSFVKGKGKEYKPIFVNFVTFSLTQVMSKNMKLSNFKDQEVNEVAWSMADGFVKTMWMNMKEYEINANDIDIFGEMYRNIVHPSLRRPVNESDKRFLKETTSEQTVKQQQDITSKESKGGGILNIFGGGRS